jgi:hypothetical protein
MGQAKNTAGTDIAGQGAPLPIDDNVKVTVAQANDGDGVTVTLLVDDGK